MRTLTTLLSLALIIVQMVGCCDIESPVSSDATLVADNGNSEGAFDNPKFDGNARVSSIGDIIGDPQVNPLWAGPDIDIGSTIIANDEENLFVEIVLNGATQEEGWVLSPGRLWVGSSIANVPSNNQGGPDPGNFPHSSDTPEEYCLSLADLGLEYGDVVYIVVYVPIIQYNQAGNIVDESYAYGGDNEAGIGSDRWFFIEYTIQGPSEYEDLGTAWAEGARFPEARNWSMYFPLYDEAGDLNSPVNLVNGNPFKTNKKTGVVTYNPNYVGEVTLEITGGYLYVTLTTDGDVVMAKAHLEVYDDTPPEGNPAPGQFTYHWDPTGDEVEEGETSNSCTFDPIPVDDIIYLAVHAEVGQWFEVDG